MKNDRTLTQEQIFEIIESERARIAGELHYELGLLMSLIPWDLEAVRQEASHLSPRAVGKLLEAGVNLDRMRLVMRNTIWSLSPLAVEESDLDIVLGEQCRRLEGIRGMRFCFVKSGTPRHLTGTQKINLFRIVQELLGHAVKHSTALNVMVRLHFGGSELQIILEEDGPTQKRLTAAGVSRKGLAEGALTTENRAHLIGADIRRETSKHGLRVTVSLPLPG